MEDWVERALRRWPNVPALFGWLSLDRRGRWRVRGETISRPQIIDTINRNYAADEHGRWYFQNGPQRGYVALEYTPLVLRAEGDRLVAHTGQAVAQPRAVYLDELGALVIDTELGAGVLDDDDLPWALERLHDVAGGAPRRLDEAALAAALALPDGSKTPLSLSLGDAVLAVTRLDAARAPAALGFVREPGPREGERSASAAAPD